MCGGKWSIINRGKKGRKWKSRRKKRRKGGGVGGENKEEIWKGKRGGGSE